MQGHQGLAFYGCCCSLAVSACRSARKAHRGLHLLSVQIPLIHQPLLFISFLCSSQRQPQFLVRFGSNDPAIFCAKAVILFTCHAHCHTPRPRNNCATNRLWVYEKRSRHFFCCKIIRNALVSFQNLSSVLREIV